MTQSLCFILSLGFWVARARGVFFLFYYFCIFYVWWLVHPKVIGAFGFGVACVTESAPCTYPTPPFSTCPPKKSSTFAKFQAKKIPRGPLPREKVRNRSFTWWDGIRIFIQRNLCKTAYWWQRRYFSDRYFARFVIFCDKIHSRCWQSIKIKDQSQVKRNTSYT